MVNINLIRKTNAALVKTQPIVAVFVGGTAGIGASSVRALAAAHGTQGRGLRVYIVGRNAKAAEALISDCRRLSPQGQFNFVKTNDLAMLNDVDQACAEIVQAEEEQVKEMGGVAKIDFMVMTQAYLAFESRKGTSTQHPFSTLSIIPP